MAMKNDSIVLNLGRMIVRSVVLLCVLASVAKCYQVFIQFQDFEIFTNEDGLPALDE